jgi:hypothetical protein
MKKSAPKKVSSKSKSKTPAKAQLPDLGAFKKKLEAIAAKQGKAPAGPKAPPFM